jgi:hypothetical protein
MVKLRICDSAMKPICKLATGAPKSWTTGRCDVSMRGTDENWVGVRKPGGKRLLVGFTCRW